MGSSSSRIRSLARPFAVVMAGALAFGFVFAGCGSSVQSPTEHATPTATVSSTPAASPTATASPTASPTPAITFPPTPTQVDDGGPIISGFERTGTWALSGSTLHLTFDGGATWSSMRVPPVDENWPLQPTLTVLDADHVWAARSGPDSHVKGQPDDFASLIVYRTADGGGTWNQVTVPGNFANSTNKLVFTDSLHGILRTLSPAAKWKWVVYRTSDGGATWRAGPSLTSTSWDTVMYEPSTVWISSTVLGAMGCTEPCRNPLIQVSRDGGVSWKTLSLPGVGQYATTGIGMSAPPVFFDADHGVAAVTKYGDNYDLSPTQIYRTSDGGRTWAATGKPIVGAVEEVSFLDANHWVAIVPNAAVTIWSTDDAGATWQTKVAESHEWTIYKSWFVDGVHGAFLGSATLPNEPTLLMYTTSDSGGTWTPVSFGS